MFKKMSHVSKCVKKLNPSVGERDDGDAHVLHQLEVILVVRLEVGAQQFPLDQLLLGRTLVFHHVGERGPGQKLKKKV
jgi:hypothetical protein